MKIEQIRKLQRSLEDQLKAVKCALKTAEELSAANHENRLRERDIRKRKAEAAWSRRAKKLFDAISCRTDGFVGCNVKILSGEHKDKIGWCTDISIHVFKSRKMKPVIECSVKFCEKIDDQSGYLHPFYKSEYAVFQIEQLKIIEK